jgi:hypothetical protein
LRRPSGVLSAKGVTNLVELGDYLGDYLGECSRRTEGSTRARRIVAEIVPELD